MTDISSTSAPWLRLVLSEEESPTADGGDARNAASTRVHELYQQHSSMLVRQLTRETGCRELARELAHEAFVRLLRLAPAKLVRIERPDAYLRRVSINLLRDWGRQHALSERSRADLQPLGEQVVDQLAALEARDTLRRLERAIAKSSATNPRGLPCSTHRGPELSGNRRADRPKRQRGREADGQGHCQDRPFP